MKPLVIAILLIALPLGLSAKPEIKGNPEDLRQFLHPSAKTVSLYAEAEETAYSDKAIVSLVITTESKRLADAIGANSELRRAITQKLGEAGISAEHIKSSKFSTSPQYGWFGDKPESYEVVNRMAVSLFDEPQLQAVAVVADDNETVEISTTSFEHTRKDEIDKQVKQQALAKVMEQKAFYEQTLGIKLTAVGFRDANMGRRGTRGAQMLEEAMITARRKGVAYSDASQSVATAPDTGSSFDEVKYRAGIHVDFSIEQETGQD